MMVMMMVVMITITNIIIIMNLQTCYPLDISRQFILVCLIIHANLCHQCNRLEKVLHFSRATYLEILR